jgi:hypothetical protein
MDGMGKLLASGMIKEKMEPIGLALDEGLAKYV